MAVIDRWYLFIILLSVAMGACQPQATPFPVVIASPTEVDMNLPTSAPIRYGIIDNAHSYLAQQSDEIFNFTLADLSITELGADYDLIMGYGRWSGWNESPISQHVALVLNAQQAPINNPIIHQLLQSIPNLESIPELANIPGWTSPTKRTVQSARDARLILANNGYLDGIELSIALSPAPGVKTITDQFQSANIFLNTIPQAHPLDPLSLQSHGYHLALVLWTQPSERELWINTIGQPNWIELYTLPISYQAIPNLTIEFTEVGWPIGLR